MLMIGLLIIDAKKNLYIDSLYEIWWIKAIFLWNL